MFTGIITDIGTIYGVEERGDRRIGIESRYDATTIDIGASICCSGVCLTVIECMNKGETSRFAVDVSAETLSKTTLDAWQVGMPVNLERALKMGDELGGHLVSGHVDGVGRVLHIKEDGDSQRWVFQVPETVAPYIAEKGSIAINGVSLTINEVLDKKVPDDKVRNDGVLDDVISDYDVILGYTGEITQFGVNIIPHTAQMTTFGTLQQGAFVNLEIDPIARYVARLLEYKDR